MNTHREIRIERDRRLQGKRRRVRPRLHTAGMVWEHLLESRVLLSTIVVSNANDSGPGSLRSAVVAAASGETIVVSKRLAGQKIALQSEIDVTHNVSIMGAAGRPVTLSGGGNTRVLEIDGASVSLANLVIANGSADIGGGILDSNGSLTLKNVRFAGNVAYGSSTEIAQGGAIAQQGGNLSIKGSTFTGNRVIGDPQSPVVLPTPIIDPLPFPDVNSTEPDVIPNPTHYGGEADGGAIADQGGTLAIRTSRFSSNLGVGSPIQTAPTGGYANGGAVFVANATLTSIDSTFVSNQAMGGNFINNIPQSQNVVLSAGDANGGAIAAYSALLTLKNNTIGLNAALGGQSQSSAGATGGGGGSAAGGAIALLQASTLSVSGGSISNNQAKGGAGASPSDLQPAYFPSSGTAAGGGIAAEDGASVSIDKTTLADDEARSGDMPSPSTSNSYTYAAAASGGAIDFVATGSLSLTQADLLDDSAIGGNAQSPGEAFGGGIDVDGGNSVTIVDSVLQGNLAESGQGFVLSPNPSSLDYNQASGGGIFDGFGSGIVSLVNTRIVANRAIGLDNAVATGGGLALNDVQVSLVKDTLLANAALGGPIVTNGTFGQALGGAIAVVGQTMTVTDSEFLGNQAMTATVNLQYAQTDSDDASLGGAIANDGATVVVSGATFIGNRASGGAGIAGTLGSNGEGGAIDSQANSSFALTSSTVVANQAIATNDGQGLGGGLYLAQNSTNTLESDTIVNNRATTAGNNIEDLTQ
jgi:hypothetical protein